MFPKYKEIQVPLLVELIRRGGQAEPSENDAKGKTVYEALADYFELSQQARNEMIGKEGMREPKWKNMVRWARNDLKKLGRLSSPSRGVWSITEAGRTFLNEVESENIGRGIITFERTVDPHTFRERQKETAEIGELGEAFVLRYEQQRLIEQGQSDLVQKVRQISMENVAAGYDILSFDIQGNEKYIEVKTSKSEVLSFELTSNELNIANKYRAAYWIYKITKIKSNSPKILQIQDPAALVQEGKLILKPTSYAISMSETFGE